MTKPVLYGAYWSPAVRAVLLTCRAIDLEIEFKEVNLYNNEHKTEEFLKKNPQHTVPVLDDDGRSIYDSHAIITYLVDKYAKDDSLYPKDLYKRAIVHQRLHFDSGILFVRLFNIGAQIRIKQDPNITKEQIDGLYEGYDIIEKFLESRDFLAGDSLTVADFSCIATVSSFQGLAPLDPAKHPKTARWINRLEKLPYYDEANGKHAVGLIEMFKKKIEGLKEKN